MSCDDLVIDVRGLGKDYLVFEKPSHRLWQMFFRGRRTFYKSRTVLDQVSFQVRRGETVGLIGRNGSGKSTLLGMICGMLEPTRGEVVLHGRVAALLELGAGFNPELSGSENIELSAQIYGLTADQVADRRADIVAFADIGDYIDQPVKTYSSGMFTRLAFSVVAHVDADVLVVDEALAVGDAYFVQKCMRFLARFKERGGTLLFVSHDMGAISSLCDRAVWLRDAGVAIDDTPKRVANAYLADLYRAQQGDAIVEPEPDPVPPVAPDSPDADPVDPRHALLMGTSLRNDIEVFRFEGGHDFGLGGARVEDVALCDAAGNRLSWIVGGELVRVRVDIRAVSGLQSPIIGFVVKDRHGQPLFGDNTYLSYLERPVRIAAGGLATAHFDFRMPVLAPGTYSLSVAVADGTQGDHVVHQWLHEAVILASRSSSLATGLMGIPMHAIGLRLVTEAAAGVGTR